MFKIYLTYSFISFNLLEAINSHFLLLLVFIFMATSPPNYHCHQSKTNKNNHSNILLIFSPLSSRSDSYLPKYSLEPWQHFYFSTQTASQTKPLIENRSHIKFGGIIYSFGSNHFSSTSSVITLVNEI